MYIVYFKLEDWSCKLDAIKVVRKITGWTLNEANEFIKGDRAARVQEFELFGAAMSAFGKMEHRATLDAGW